MYQFFASIAAICGTSDMEDKTLAKAASALRCATSIKYPQGWHAESEQEVAPGHEVP